MELVMGVKSNMDTNSNSVGGSIYRNNNRNNKELKMRIIGIAGAIVGLIICLLLIAFIICAMIISGDK